MGLGTDWTGGRRMGQITGGAHPLGFPLKDKGSETKAGRGLTGDLVALLSSFTL